jgi:hypothetical protein
MAGPFIVLALLGVVISETTLAGFHKIPFTCSYLPGKSNINLTFLLCIWVFGALVDHGAALELDALSCAGGCATMIVILLIAAALARRRTAVLATSQSLRFEELPAPAVLVLGLHKD